MRYVPTAPPPLSAPTSALTPSARRTVRDLHQAAATRAWAGRVGGRAALAGAAAAAVADGGLAALLAALRAEVTRYVYALRAEGARPEQMLVRVKAFVREAMAAEGWADPEAVDALTTHVVGWSIAAYYDR